jgi:two-component system response regulator RegA
MKQLLILEDDVMFREALLGEFAERGYEVRGCASLKDLQLLKNFKPTHAIVDLKLQGESGLDAVAHLKGLHSDCQIIVLTGYGSIASAVQAMRRGAVNYISKPASIDAIEQAFAGGMELERPLPEPPKLYEHEREYIEKILHDCDGNISRAAKALGIHRQSLQRKLRKYT